jgi:hypothetical protein
MNSGPVAVRAVLAGWIKKQTRLLFFSLHQIRSRLFSHSVCLPNSKEHGDWLWKCFTTVPYGH